MTATLDRSTAPAVASRPAPALCPHRLARWALLATTALLYSWGLGKSGWANAYRTWLAT